jgi:alpha-galactosidase/6-phospho-beta-glucosidase family protein
MAGRKVKFSDVEEAVENLRQIVEKVQLNNPDSLSREKLREVAVKYGLVETDSEGTII